MTARPTVLAPDLRALAVLNRELGFRRQWVGWRLECRKDRWTKPPKRIDGSPASSTDPSTWSHFEEVVAALSDDRAALDGIGFVLAPADPFTAVDLDHCIGPDGAIEGWAEAIAAELRSYAERSPIDGARVLVRARKPAGACRSGKVELYDRARFVTLTGHRLDGAPARIEARPRELAGLHRRLMGGSRPVSGEVPAVALDRGDPTPDDREWLELVCQIDPSVRSLHAGRWRGTRWDEGPDRGPSLADAGLIGKLLHYGAAPDRVQRLVRGSALARPKYDRSYPGGDYLTYTIARFAAMGGRS